MILTKPPTVLYKDLKTKIGCPKDYDQNVKEEFAINREEISVDIPKEILRLNCLDNPIPEPEPTSEDQNTEEGDESKVSSDFHSHRRKGLHQSRLSLIRRLKLLALSTMTGALKQE
jgi:hypothetical protein